MNYRNLIFFVLLITSCSKNDGAEKTDERVTVKLSANREVITNHAEISLTASVDKDISKADFYLDGFFIGSKIARPYTIFHVPVDISPGMHTFKCIVESLNGLTFSDSLTLNCELRIGDKYFGGIIFHFTEAGVHGLIAASSDLYANGTERFYWANEVSIGRDMIDGIRNTGLMKENSSSAEQVGHILSNYVLNNFSDWYIPAIKELEILKQQKNIIGGFTEETGWKGLYWSSSELSRVNAEALNFNTMMGNNYGKNATKLKVRLIRRF